MATSQGGRAGTIQKVTTTPLTGRPPHAGLKKDGRLLLDYVWLPDTRFQLTSHARLKID